MSNAPFRQVSFVAELVLATAAQWSTSPDYVLQQYQIGRETDTTFQKTGDGVMTWANLAYDSSDAPGRTITITDNTTITSANYTNYLGGLIVLAVGSGNYTVTFDATVPAGLIFNFLQTSTDTITIAASTVNNLDTHANLGGRYAWASVYTGGAGVVYLTGQTA